MKTSFDLSLQMTFLLFSSVNRNTSRRGEGENRKTRTSLKVRAGFLYSRYLVFTLSSRGFTPYAEKVSNINENIEKE